MKSCLNVTLSLTWPSEYHNWSDNCFKTPSTHFQNASIRHPKWKYERKVSFSTRVSRFNEWKHGARIQLQKAWRFFFLAARYEWKCVDEWVSRGGTFQGNLSGARWKFETRYVTCLRGKTFQLFCVSARDQLSSTIPLDDKIGSAGKRVLCLRGLIRITIYAHENDLLTRKRWTGQCNSIARTRRAHCFLLPTLKFYEWIC